MILNVCLLKQKPPSNGTAVRDAASSISYLSNDGPSGLGSSRGFGGHCLRDGRRLSGDGGGGGGARSQRCTDTDGISFFGGGGGAVGRRGKPGGGGAVEGCGVITDLGGGGGVFVISGLVGDSGEADPGVDDGVSFDTKVDEGWSSEGADGGSGGFGEVVSVNTGDNAGGCGGGSGNVDAGVDDDVVLFDTEVDCCSSESGGGGGGGVGGGFGKGISVNTDDNAGGCGDENTRGGGRNGPGLQ